MLKKNADHNDHNNKTWSPWFFGHKIDSQKDPPQQWSKYKERIEINKVWTYKGMRSIS